MISIAGLWIVTTWVGIAFSIFLADNYDGNEKIDQQKYQVRDLCDDLTRPLSLDNPSPTKTKFGDPSNVTPVNCFLVVKPGY